MRTKLKRYLVAMLTCSLMLCCAIPVHAEKKQFVFTTAATQGRTAPAQKGDLEQAAYITTTYHSDSASVALGVDSGSQYGIRTVHSTFKGPREKVKLGYDACYADMSRTYYLFYDPFNGRGTTIQGRYNP